MEAQHCLSEEKSKTPFVLSIHLLLKEICSVYSLRSSAPSAFK